MAEQQTSKLPEPVAQAVASITFIPERELARAFGFGKVSWKFRDFLDQAGIEPVPGRPGFYDPKIVRARLDAIQNYSDATNTQMSLTQQRRKRLGKA
ncbi:hypothetical protein [Rhodosalinus sediminis]|jgi:hypothetical protein|uniref:hypothetical protein n=1 Tax=Rhodosalinus sediminis TaxID=1940533 RepID=UPI0023538F72|nr:hypothetical protein [Rhodosalinus sediminis]